MALSLSARSSGYISQLWDLAESRPHKDISPRPSGALDCVALIMCDLVPGLRFSLILGAQSSGGTSLMMIFLKHHTIDREEHASKTKNDPECTIATQIQGPLLGSQFVEVPPSPDFCRSHGLRL